MSNPEPPPIQGSHEVAVSEKRSGVFGDDHATGTRCCDATYVDGVRQGPGHMYYQMNGKLYAEETWAGGKLEGLTRLYYESGVLQAELMYKDGLLDGVCRTYDESGKS